jgi:hypothetical protein
MIYPFIAIDRRLITHGFMAYLKKSLLPPLFQRGEIPPFCKGREGGIRELMSGQ